MSPPAPLIPADAIARRVDEIAAEVARALPQRFWAVAVLKGGFIFLADLVRALERHGRAPRIEFMRLASYGAGTESSGAPRLMGDVPVAVAGQPVLLVDDIVDTGRSLVRAVELLEGAGAAHLWTCVLVDKPSRRQVAVEADFTGFTVTDRFVVGYGIDHAEDYRHLPYIGAID